jgi:hypothetical protein
MFDVKARKTDTIARCGFLGGCPNLAITAFMKQFLVGVLTVLTILSSVWANLGDSEDELNRSYGKWIERRPREDGTISNLYEKGDYLFFAIFLRGVSVFEMYSHADGSNLSEKEIARFLKANAGGATWTPDNKSNERRFERSDHKAEATYVNMAGRPTLTVRELHTKR